MAAVRSIGIVGADSLAARQYGRAIMHAPGLKLSRVCDLNLASAQGLTHGLESQAQAFDTVSSMLAGEALDAIIIATHDEKLLEAAKVAAGLGTSVLLEPHSGMSLAHCQQIVAEFAQSPGTFSAGYRLRFHPGHQHIMERLHAGDFGELKLVRCHAANRREESTSHSSPSLTELKALLIDQALWATQRPNSSIANFAATRRKRDAVHDAEICGTWTYKDGAVVQLFCSDLWGRQDSRIELHCADARIVISDSLGIDGGGSIAIEREVLSWASVSQRDAQVADLAMTLNEDCAPRCAGELAVANGEILNRFATESDEVVL